MKSVIWFFPVYYFHSHRISSKATQQLCMKSPPEYFQLIKCTVPWPQLCPPQYRPNLFKCLMCRTWILVQLIGGFLKNISKYISVTYFQGTIRSPRSSLHCSCGPCPRSGHTDSHQAARSKINLISVLSVRYFQSRVIERVNAEFFAAISHAIVVVTAPLNTLFMMHFGLCLLVPAFEFGHVVEKVKIQYRLFTVFKSEAQIVPCVEFLADSRKWRDHVQVTVCCILEDDLTKFNRQWLPSHICYIHPRIVHQF